eukprot:11985363-Ditylum_brightwellii.AAC.1
MSKLQNAANSVKIRQVFYSTSVFSLQEHLKRIVDIVYKKDNIEVEAGIVTEPAFENKNDKDAYYSNHNIKNNDEDKEKLMLRKAHAIY